MKEKKFSSDYYKNMTKNMKKDCEKFNNVVKFLQKWVEVLCNYGEDTARIIYMKRRKRKQ